LAITYSEMAEWSDWICNFTHASSASLGIGKLLGAPVPAWDLQSL